MASYIVLGKFTKAGMDAIAETAEQLDQVRQRTASKLGVTFQFYVTLGAYDIVWVLEAPNDEAVARWVLAMGRAGQFTTQTMRAFTESEAMALIQGEGAA